MSKRARKLWLGDWQRDAEPDQADAFVITPDEGPEPQSAQRQPNYRRGVVLLAAIALLFVLGFALSAGGGDNTPLVAQQPQDQLPQVPQVPQGAPPQGFGGPDLTGAEAAKAAQAALQKYPGNVERVTPGPNGGGYVVHVIQPDGNEVHVLVDGQFHVQGSDANSGPPGFGSGTSQ